MWLFGEKKTGGFAKKRPDLVNKSVSPDSSPPKLDTPFVIIWSSFFRQKTQTIDKINDFLILCDHQLFQQDHVRFTFEDPHVLQKAHQTSDQLFTENIEKHQILQHFRLSRKWTKMFIFVQNSSDFVGITADCKANSRDSLSFNFCSLSLQKLRQFGLTFCYQNTHFF